MSTAVRTGRTAPLVPLAKPAPARKRARREDEEPAASAAAPAAAGPATPAAAAPSPRPAKRARRASAGAVGVGLTSLVEAAAAGDVPRLRREVEAAPAGAVNAREPAEGWTALRLAAAFGRLDAVRWLLEHGGAELERGERLSNALLTQEQLERVLGPGAPRVRLGHSTLHLAALGGHLDVVRYLVREHGADPEAATAGPWRVLHCALFGGCLETASWLMDARGCSPHPRGEEWSPLSAAALGGRAAAVRHLLERRGCRPLARLDSWGNTDAHYAAAGGSVEVLELLLGDAGGAPLVLPGHEPSVDASPAAVAAGNGRMEALRYLVEARGCDPAAEDRAAAEAAARGERSCRADTALMRALANGHVEVARYLVRHCGCDPRGTGGGGAGGGGAGDEDDEEAPLAYVIDRGSLEAVRFLMEECGVRLACEDGSTELHVAARAARLDVVTYLVERHGLEPDRPKDDGETPLRSSLNADIVRYLATRCSLEHCDEALLALCAQRDFRRLPWFPGAALGLLVAGARAPQGIADGWPSLRKDGGEGGGGGGGEGAAGGDDGDNGGNDDDDDVVDAGDDDGLPDANGGGGGGPSFSLPDADEGDDEAAESHREAIVEWARGTHPVQLERRAVVASSGRGGLIRDVALLCGEYVILTRRP